MRKLLLEVNLMGTRTIASILLVLTTIPSILGHENSARALPNKLQVITAENADRIEEVARLGNGSVAQLLWSPDSQYIAAFGASGAWLFDRDSISEPKAHIQTHTDRVEYAAFSSDSRLIATGSDNAVSITAVETGELLYTLEMARGLVAFSPDGNWLLTDSQSASNSPIVWSLSSGKMVVNLERNDLASLATIAFSQDGSQVAAVYESLRWGYMNAIKIWDTQTWDELLQIPTAGQQIQWLSFSDSNTQLTACAKSGILAWNVEDGSSVQLGSESLACPEINHTEVLDAFGIDPDDVQGEVLSPDQSNIAFIDADGFIEIANILTQQRQASPFAFSSPYIGRIAFSPNSQLIGAVEQEYDGAVDVRLWDLTPMQTGRTSITIPDGERVSTIHLTFLSNNHLMIYDDGDGRVCIWNIEAGKFIADFYIEIEERSVLAVNPDLSAITSVNWQADVPGVPSVHMQTWDIPSGAWRTEYLNPGSYEQSPTLWNAIYSPNGDFIATAGRAAHLWNVQTGEEVAVLYDYTFPEGQWEIDNVVFSPTGRFLVADTKQWNSLLYVWDVQQAIETYSATLQDPLTDTHSLVAQLSHVSAAFVFSPNGELLVSGAHGSFWGGDSSIQIWNTSNWQPITTLYAHIDGVNSLALTPDGTLLASAGFDGTIRLWGVEE